MISSGTRTFIPAGKEKKDDIELRKLGAGVGLVVLKRIQTYKLKQSLDD